MQFADFDFHSAITTNIKALGYETPTPIQSEAMPHVIAGRDVMGLAQTGTGKTAAFLLPIIDRFLKNPKPLRGSCRCLIIAPTRELAEQIHEAARDYTKGLRFRTVTVYGGVGLGPQANNLRRGADIVVACPGRLLDHLNQGNANLSGVDVLVLDEADHMFDMGFLPDIKKILSRLPAERQTLLFSATMPDSIRGLANETLKDPALVRIGRTAPACTIEQCLYPVPQHLKTKLLLTLLDDNKEGSVLVFTRTKHRAKRLAEQLDRSGYSSSCLQGNLSQAQRQKAMEGFRAGRFRILVATDIAARGIDVSRVSHVVNYDLPDTPETYTHRVGRTGRAEREGQAHTLVTSDDVSMVRAIERLLGKAIDRRKLPGFDYAASSAERNTEFDRPPLRNERSGHGQGQRGQYGRSGSAYSGANGGAGDSGRSAYGDRGHGHHASGAPSRGNAGSYGSDQPRSNASDREGNSWQAPRGQYQGRPARAEGQGGYARTGSQAPAGRYADNGGRPAAPRTDRQDGGNWRGQDNRRADGYQGQPRRQEGDRSDTRRTYGEPGQSRPYAGPGRDDTPRAARPYNNRGGNQGFYGRPTEGDASGNRETARREQDERPVAAKREDGQAA
ncbi:MAG: hypothetical protein FD177_1629 [Desulfovibrionaceae bacterium]|nr:MAG: hypothetical protein FD177_1629 [Desulfovibrionaceae bacterium]